jgi:hypothetical protein
MRIPLVTALIAAGGLAAACGGGGLSGSAAVSVDGHVISKATIDRSMSVIAANSSTAPGQPKLERPIPPQYSACIAYFRAYRPAPPEGGPDSTSAQLKARCKEEYEKEKLKALYFWIGAAWVDGEAADLGVRIAASELNHQLALFKQGYPSEAAFEQYLRETKTPLSELMASFRLVLLESTVQKKLESEKGVSGLSVEQRQQRLRWFGQRFERKWRARTDCGDGYVVALCRQYKAPKKPPALVPPSVPLTNLAAR